MHPNAETLHRFYTAFAARDAAGMAACYADDAEFSDHAFPGLRGPEISAMWRMLCERGKDLRVEFRDIDADDHRGRAHWEAWYTFSRTGRKVHNIIDATFAFRDGKIVRHDDRFPMWRWARQAMGPAGWLLGWSGAFARKVQQGARQQLDAFMRR